MRVSKKAPNVFAEAPSGLTDEVRAFILSAIEGAIAAAKVVPDFTDVQLPKTKDDYSDLVTRGVARALSLATTSKEASDAVKAATFWYSMRHGKDEGGGYGTGLKEGAEDA